LFDRSDKEFRYTLNAFNLFSQPNKAKNYLKDTSKIDLSEFMNGDVVKPAGLNGETGDTIFNTIEGWAKDNEYSAQEIADRTSKTHDLPQISVEDLKKLKDTYLTVSRDSAENALKKNNALKKGIVIFSPYITHTSNGFDIDKNESERGFYMWDGNSWVKYDTPDANRIAEHS
jgi:hypothetical protein